MGFFSSVVIVYSAMILGVVSFIPGGFGVTEASMLGLLLKAGLALSIASSIVLISRLSGIWFSIVIGIISKLYLFKNIHRA